MLHALVILSSCEQAFEPIQTPEDLHFSVYGFLDASASADTQWVRVSGVRDRIHTSPDPLDAVVTLENLETGKTVVLRDSAFTYQRELGSELHAVNFWTTERIAPGANYRVLATRSDGASATATVRVPAPFPPEVVVEITWKPRGQSPPDLVRVEGPEHVSLVEVLHHIPEECVIGFNVFRVRQPLPASPAGSPTNEGSHAISVTKVRSQDDLGMDRQNPVPCHRPVIKYEIHLVSSGSAWPSQFLHSSVVAHMDLAFNVENAVGFVGGVIRKTVPYEECTYPDRRVCQLIYGPESASLQGTVRDHFCDGRPIDHWGTDIVLTEVETGKIRTTQFDRHGRYEVGALVPGVVHELRLARPAVTPAHHSFGSRLPSPGYETYVDTLVFDAGESRMLDIPLRRFTGDCPPNDFM